MATATAPALLPIDAYLRSEYEPDSDYVDGLVQERNVGEREHAQVQWLIAELLGSVRKRLGIVGLIEQRIQVSEQRVRVCDVVLLHPGAPYEKVTSHAPLACIEILSPEDRISRAHAVLSDYFAMGVQNIWLIDPVRRCAFVFDGRELRSQVDGKLTVAGTDILLDLNHMFQEIDSANT